MNLNTKMKITVLMALGVIFIISSITIVNNHLIINAESIRRTNSGNENLKISKVFGKIHIYSKN